MDHTTELATRIVLITAAMTRRVSLTKLWSYVRIAYWARIGRALA